MDNCCKTEILAELCDYRRRLSADLGNCASALNLGSAGSEDALSGSGALRHGTLRCGSMLALQA